MSASTGLRFAPALALAFASVLLIVSLATAAPPSSDRGDGSRKNFVPHQTFRSLDDAIARAEEELDTDYGFDVAGLVYTIRTPTGQVVRAHTELHLDGTRYGGFIPDRASTAHAVLRPVCIRESTRIVELRIMAPGFDRYTRRVTLRAGELLVWDDIVLTPISRQSAASVVGRVRLEYDDDGHEGIEISIDGEVVAKTDASGYFEAKKVSAGKLQVRAYKRGYFGLSASVEVVAGDQQACELVGYRKRFARVRWVYQPSGMRDFYTGTHTGTAVLAHDKLHSVSFSKGFQQVHSRSDYYLRQKKDQLFLRGASAPRSDSPTRGMTLFVGRTLDDLHVAPGSGYSSTGYPLRAGDVYVFRCYDGEHYAMMEIREITDEPPSDESR